MSAYCCQMKRFGFLSLRLIPSFLLFCSRKKPLEIKTTRGSTNVLIYKNVIDQNHKDSLLVRFYHYATIDIGLTNRGVVIFSSNRRKHFQFSLSLGTTLKGPSRAVLSAYHCLSVVSKEQCGRASHVVDRYNIVGAEKVNKRGGGVLITWLLLNTLCRFTRKKLRKRKNGLLSF